MPLIQSTTSALPYIDAAPSTEALAAADALVQAELGSEDQSTLHASIPAKCEPRFSTLIEAEHARIAGGQDKEGGIDMSRYEALDAPAKGDLAAWKATLQKAYASTEYLRGREINLGLLETYGKNAWLIGNSQLEDVLKYLEKDVEAVKLEQEAVEGQRKAAQSNVAGEMQSLEEGWRTGVGRMIEAQAAAERLKQEILERKRMAAS
jgi:pre-mRNA-splicing factor SPF27